MFGEILKSFHKIGLMFHKIRPKKIIVGAAILLSLAASIQKSRAQNSDILYKYVTLIEQVSSTEKNIDLKKHPEILDISNILIKDLREKVYKFIDHQDYESAINSAVNIKQIGEVYGDDTIVSSANYMISQIVLSAEKDKEINVKEVKKMLKEFENSPLSRQDIKDEIKDKRNRDIIAKEVKGGNFEVSGLGWQYKKSDVPGIGRNVISFNVNPKIRLNADYPIAISREEVKKAVSRLKYSDECKSALEEEVASQMCR